MNSVSASCAIPTRLGLTASLPHHYRIITASSLHHHCITIASPDPIDHTLMKRDLTRNLAVGVLLVALAVGVQLGSLPWRYRRELWQLQGFAAGALLGYGVGRLSSRVGQSGSPGNRPGIGQD